MTFIKKQDGMALITVLLATALIAVLAVGMTSAQQIAIKRTSNLVENDQAMLLSLGLEEWAIQLLLRDRQQEGGTDHLAENWALTLMPTATENGVITGHIVDLQGRVNLNNLELGDEPTIEQTRRILTGLFNLCEVDDDYQAIQALADWLDADSEIRPGGAEDNEYLHSASPYLAANRLLTSPSELLLVDGVSVENYGCLNNHLTALPAASAINLNTAGPEIISALSDKISLAAAEEIVKDRPEEGYRDIADFLAHPALAGSTITADGLSLTSDFFLVRGQASFGDAEIRLNSVVARRPDTVEILGRSIGTY
ncbi:MAG: type II secretion system minor pseudopilin GspK [Thermodesulfobacteriota bacterium]